MDFSPEVWVGRIPVYDEQYSTLDSILQKIMDYQSSPASQNAWRKSALLPSGYQDVGYDGAPLTEQMIDDYLGCRGYYHWTMYQQGTICTAANSSYSSNQELVGGTVVRDRWAAMNPGVMLWWGHGAPTYTVVGYSGCSANYMLRNTDVTNLNDAYPAFAYLNSCTNGYPESSVNLQYSLLKQGGIGVVSATRVSWFNSGGDVWAIRRKLDQLRSGIRVHPADYRLLWRRKGPGGGQVGLVGQPGFHYPADELL